MLRGDTELRRVIDLPHDLDVFDPEERKVIERFLRAVAQEADLLASASG